MKQILFMSLVFVGVIWMGCKKEITVPDPPPEPEPAKAVRLEREVSVSTVNRDTLFKTYFHYNDIGNLTAVKVYDKYGNPYKLYNYSDGVLMSHWFADSSDRFSYEYGESMVTINQTDRDNGDTIKTTFCYLIWDNFVNTSVVKGTEDTLYFDWYNENLAYIYSGNYPKTDAYKYFETAKNPYQIMYRSIKMNGLGSEYFYREWERPPMATSRRELVKTIEFNGESYPLEFKVHVNMEPRVIHYLEYLEE